MIMTFNEYLKNGNKVDIEVLTNTIKNLCDLEKKNYLNNLSYDINDIMYLSKTKELIFNAKLENNKQQDFKYEVSKLLIRLLRYVDTNDKKAMALGYALFVASSKDDYKMSDLLKKCDEYSTKKEIDPNIDYPQMKELIDDEKIRDEVNKEEIAKDNNKKYETKDFYTHGDILIYDLKDNYITSLSIKGEGNYSHLSIDKLIELSNSEKSNTNNIVILNVNKSLYGISSQKGFNYMDIEKYNMAKDFIEKNTKMHCLDMISINAEDMDKLLAIKSEDYNNIQGYSYKFNEKCNLTNHTKKLEINEQLKRTQGFNQTQEETNKNVLKQ